MSSLERNCAEAAYYLKHYSYYGSQAKAVAALRRRKDTRHCGREELEKNLNHAQQILDKMDALVQETLSRYHVEFHFQMTADQFCEGRESIRLKLLSEFQENAKSIDYFLSRNWDMPYVR